jgi:hypothetical protein
MLNFSRKRIVATKKQKEELMDILKFQPITVKVMIQGYGGETYAGRVDRKIYDYFASRRLDISDYAGDWDNEMDVPDDLQPFPPGSAYECDDLWHACGAELSDLNKITVENEKGDTMWEHDLGWSSLEESGVTVTESGNTMLDDLPDGTVVHWGGQGEKGCFFDGDFVLKAPFDPKKLEISFENCDDWYIITSVIYDGEEIDGSGGYSTTGKWGENKWVIAGGEEVYQPTDDEDGEDVPVLDGEEMQAQEAIDAESDRSPWFDADVKPEIKGEYEVFEQDSSWPFPMRAEWTGRGWKEGGRKITIKQWRGLNYDPSEA